MSVGIRLVFVLGRGRQTRHTRFIAFLLKDVVRPVLGYRQALLVSAPKNERAGVSVALKPRFDDSIHRLFSPPFVTRSRSSAKASFRLSSRYCSGFSRFRRESSADLFGRRSARRAARRRRGLSEGAGAPCASDARPIAVEHDSLDSSGFSRRAATVFDGFGARAGSGGLKGGPSPAERSTSGSAAPSASGPGSAIGALAVSAHMAPDPSGAAAG